MPTHDVHQLWPMELSESVCVCCRRASRRAGFDGQTVHSAGNLVAFGGRKEVVYGVVGHGDLKGAVCHLKLAAPCGCAGKHFAVAPRGCLGRFQQHFADFFRRMLCRRSSDRQGLGIRVCVHRLLASCRSASALMCSHEAAITLSERMALRAASTRAGGEQQRGVLIFADAPTAIASANRSMAMFFHHDI